MALGLILGLAAWTGGFAKDDAARIAALKAWVKAIAEETSYVQSRPPFTAPQRLDDELGRLEALADAKELQLARIHSVRAGGGAFSR